ncbi:SRPBCC family protein [Oerskovia flava]|uniref:SRPBCC family protein n=1 Tax=Oerskovia flava TaxID=2986422 RepID=UPI002240BD86|nr:SRPBCC family protein [Oerskovia sp. JB1-3-2]
MKPVVVRSSIDLDVPAAVAWEYLSVYTNDLAWRAGLETMSQDPPGPVHDGARVVEVLRVLGRRVESLVEVSDVHAGRSFSWRVVEGATAQGSRAVTPATASSCRVDVVKQLTLSGTDRLLRPLVAAVVARTERQDLQRLQQVLGQRMS